MIYLQPLTRVVQFLDASFFQKKWWPWVLPLVCWVLSIFFSWRYDHWASYGWPVEKAWQVYEFKFDHVWESTCQYYPPSTHHRQLDGRILVPVFAHYLGLKQTGMVVVYHFCGGLIFLSAYFLAKKYSQSTSIASLFTLGIAGLICGNECFSGEPFYDTVCLLFLVLSLLCPSLFAQCLLVVLALLTDERAICGLPALVAHRYWTLVPSGEFNIRRFASSLWPYAASLFAWIVLRVAMWYGLHLSGTGEGTNLAVVLSQTWVAIPAAWMGCLEAFWILPVLALLALIAERRGFLIFLLVIAVATPLVLTLWVSDLSRSLVHLLLPLLLALRLLCSIEKRWLSEILLLAAAINLLTPNYLISSHTPRLIPNLPLHLFLDRKH